MPSLELIDEQGGERLTISSIERLDQFMVLDIASDDFPESPIFGLSVKQIVQLRTWLDDNLAALNIQAHKTMNLNEKIDLLLRLSTIRINNAHSELPVGTLTKMIQRLEESIRRDVEGADGA